MKEFVLKDEMPISVEEFWTLFFKEEEFTLIYHERRGDTDAQVGAWTVAPEGRKQRIVRFVSPTASNSSMRMIAGVTTQIKEIQLCHFTAEGGFNLQTKTLFEKSSLVEMDCKMRWEAIPTKNGCCCTISVSNEYKGRLFKDAIENYVKEVTQDAAEQWLELAHNRIADYLPEVAFSRELPSLVQESISMEGKGDESEEDAYPSKKVKGTKTKHVADETAEGGSLRESATERARRIIANTASSDESEDDEEEDETENTDSDESEDSSEEEEDARFFEANDELSALVKFDGASTNEERLALLQAYSRAMQNELKQLKEIVNTVQTRMMRLETPQPPSTPVQQHHYRNGYTPLSESSNGFNTEEKETRYRDLAIQRALANTQRRLEEIEQTLASNRPAASPVKRSPSNSSSSIEVSDYKKKKAVLLPFLTNNSWLINASFIMFVICWPLVSHKVFGWTMDWSSRLLHQIQRLFTSRFN